MRNLKLTVEFDGTNYAGWQYQPHRQTVQGELESAAGKVLQQKVTVYGCGRTDAGVSARAYVANVHVDSPHTVERLKLALYHFLPEDILVLSIEEAAPGSTPGTARRERPTSTASCVASLPCGADTHGSSGSSWTL